MQRGGELMFLRFSAAPAYFVGDWEGFIALEIRPSFRVM